MSGTAELKVNFTDLENSHTTCVNLKKEFDDLPHRVGDIDWSDSHIHDSMHTFGTNWGYHREVLSGKIQEVGEKAESCLTTFQQADTQLYNELNRQSKGGEK